MGPRTVRGEKFTCMFQIAKRGHFKCPQIKKNFFDGDSPGRQGRNTSQACWSACPPSGKRTECLAWDAWLLPLFLSPYSPNQVPWFVLGVKFLLAGSSSG